MIVAGIALAMDWLGFSCFERIRSDKELVELTLGESKD
jgi:hypothetical protein